MSLLRRIVRQALKLTRTELLPVRIRGGFAAGAKWSLFPWSAYWRGTHEPAFQQALILLHPGVGSVFWDIGAHYGLYAIGAALRCGPTGQVAAFEPNPISFARLELHRQRNKLQHLRAYPSAVSDQDGTLELLRYGQDDSTTTHLAFEGETLGPQTDPLSVPVVRLDTLVARRELRPPHIVKIDAEGHGHKVLLGARATLAAHRPIILMGFHCEAEISGAHAVLNPLGYQPHSIQPDGHLVPVSNDAIKNGEDFVFIVP